MPCSSCFAQASVDTSAITLHPLGQDCILPRVMQPSYLCYFQTFKRMNGLQACLISAWVKSGMWLSPDISQVLDIQVLSHQASAAVPLNVPVKAVAVQFKRYPLLLFQQHVPMNWLSTV